METITLRVYLVIGFIIMAYLGFLTIFVLDTIIGIMLLIAGIVLSNLFNSRL